MDRTFRKRALRPSPIRSESQYRTVLPVRAACERAVHACRHTCRAFPTAANITVKAGDSIGTRDADESNEEERNRRAREAGARDGKDNYRRKGEGARGIQ